jgi:hypothetical protein
MKNDEEQTARIRKIAERKDWRMTRREQNQLKKILQLDREMTSVEFTVSVINALIADLSQDMHRVDMQRELNEIMERAFGGAE